MKPTKFSPFLLLVIFSSFFLAACGPKKEVKFSDDSAETISPYVDKFANQKITITQTYAPNQEFKVSYKTFSPDGVGTAEFKAKSVKEVTEVDGRLPEEGKKLVLVEIAIRGNGKNKGNPTTFNQVGDTPSPQFVIIDPAKNFSEVETTYYSDAYTVSKKLFELSKITMDHEQWVNTALVFQIDKGLSPDLAFRFVNPEGKTEFYDIK